MEQNWIDVVAALIPLADRLAQLGNPRRGRVPVVAPRPGLFHQLVDDVRGRGEVGVPKAQVDHVLAGPPGLELELVHDAEHIGRESLHFLEAPHGVLPAAPRTPSAISA